MFSGIGAAGDGGGDVWMGDRELQREFRDVDAVFGTMRRGLAAAAFTASGSLSHGGSGALVSSRAVNGPAFITPMPRVFK